MRLARVGWRDMRSSNGMNAILEASGWMKFASPRFSGCADNVQQLSQLTVGRSVDNL